MTDIFDFLSEIFTDDSSSKKVTTNVEFKDGKLKLGYIIDDPEHEYIDENGELTDKIDSLMKDVKEEFNPFIRIYSKAFGIDPEFSFDLQIGARTLSYEYRDGKFDFVGVSLYKNEPKSVDVDEKKNEGIDEKIDNKPISVPENLKKEFVSNATCDSNFWEDDPYAGSPSVPELPEGVCFAKSLKHRIESEREEYENHCHVNCDLWISAIVDTAQSNQDYNVHWNEGRPVYIEFDLDDLVEDFWTNNKDAEYIIENESDKLDEFMETVCKDLGFSKAEYYEDDAVGAFDEKGTTIILRLYF